MADHAVSIHRIPGSRGVDTPSVPLASGDSITFTAEANAPSILCLSSETAGIVSPTPLSTSIEVPSGASVTLTVGDVSPGKYGIVVQAHGWPCPGEISSQSGGSEAVLLIHSADGAAFPGQGDNPPGSGD